MGKYSNYKYYHGEANCPFNDESGKGFWWKVESYAFEKKDEKAKDELSMTMVLYLKELHWQGDEAHSDTTLEEFIRRAEELYRKGIWSRSYICLKSFNIKDAERENAI